MLWYGTGTCVHAFNCRHVIHLSYIYFLIKNIKYRLEWCISKRRFLSPSGQSESDPSPAVRLTVPLSRMHLSSPDSSLFLITSAYYFQRHHSLIPSPLQSFILASKPFFSINPTLDRLLDWFHGLLDCSSAFLAQPFTFVSVFRFQFSKSFSSSVIFSSLLLSTPIYPLLVCFLANQPHCHCFFVFINFSSYALG